MADRNIGKADCEHCGNEFILKQPNNRFCDRNCANRWFGKERKRIKLEQVKSGFKTCTYCQEEKALTEFNKSSACDGLTSHCKQCDAQQWQAYISNPQRREQRNRNQRQFNRTLAGKARRRQYRDLPHVREKKRQGDRLRQNLTRVRIACNPSEYFEDKDIFERDGWKCGLCNKKVNRKRKAPHPDSPSLDHIIPLSRGGKHTRRNVQCSHLGCNIKKSNKILGQLRLLG